MFFLTIFVYLGKIETYVSLYSPKWLLLFFYLLNAASITIDCFEPPLEDMVVDSLSSIVIFKLQSIN